MEKSAIDRMCSGCLHLWMIRDPTSEPGLNKTRVPACQYMHFLDPQGEAARQYVERYVESKEKPSGAEIDDMKAGAIPCSKLTECPNPVQVAKFVRLAA